MTDQPQGHPGALVGDYLPGDSLLHRLPVGAKLLFLGAFGFTVVAVRSMPMAWVFLSITLLLALIGQVGSRTLVRAARAVVPIAVMIAAFQWWLFSRDKAIESVVDLITLSLMSVVFTSTTSPQRMLDRITVWVRPLRHVGIPPERISLAFSLAMQAIPAMLLLARETRDAARSRGLDRNARAHLSPLVIRSIARAYETADALHARGIAD